MKTIITVISISIFFFWFAVWWTFRWILMNKSINSVSNHCLVIMDEINNNCTTRLNGLWELCKQSQGELFQLIK